MFRLISICGIDGSGKTTQIKLLERYLSQRSFKVKYIWFRWPVLFSYSLLALSRILGYTKWEIISRSNVRYAERRFYINKALARLWPWLFIIDTFIYSFFKIRVWRNLGYIILCDRFIPDILIDLIYETRDYTLPRRVVGRLFLSLIPRDSKLIVINVTENTAYSRKHDIPSIDYLKERRRLYLYLAKILSMPIINGEKKMIEVHRSILKLLDPIV